MIDDETLDLDSRLAYTVHLRYMAGALPLDSPIFNTREARAYRTGYKAARQGNGRDAIRWGMSCDVELVLFGKGYEAGEM